MVTMNIKICFSCSKEQLEISLFERVDNDYKLVVRNNVIVGENRGDKFVEGDKKLLKVLMN